MVKNLFRSPYERFKMFFERFQTLKKRVFLGSYFYSIFAVDCVGKLNLFLMEKHSPFFLSQENRHHSWQLFAGSCSWYRSQSNGGTSVAISVILQTNVWTHGNHTIISSYFKIIFYKMLVISAKSGGGALRTQLRSMIGIYYLYCFYHSISFLGKCLRLHIHWPLYNMKKRTSIIIRLTWE